MKKPLISIITVVYNACLTLEATIQSVISQKREFIEYRIIDGGSTDGSVDIIRLYEDQLTGWSSEPDNGIYDAMNKGVDRALGEWLFFLGADDQLMPGIIQQVVPYLDPTLKAVYGSAISDIGDEFRSRVSLWSVIENTLHHQSAFYNRKLFDGFRYDTQYRINADYELTLRLYFEKHSNLYIPYAITVYGTKGASSILNSKETNHLRGTYVKNIFLNNILSHVLALHYFYHRYRKKVRVTVLTNLKKIGILWPEKIN